MVAPELGFDPLHTLGFLLTDWTEHHCRVPGGVYDGEPLVFNGWQLKVNVNHYRVRPDAVADPRRLLAPFVYRRSIVVGPQKCGKSPFGAGWLLQEGVGPSLFAGWAREGDVYRCSDHGCPCGWEYEYLPGEAMGVPRRKSLLGLLAFAESQTANVYEPLQTMIHSGPLQEIVKVREGFIRLPNAGRITPLSSAARSKLGRPLTGALGDESGLYTSGNKVLDAWQTIRRGCAGMQGRTIELTNPWDPMENSAAQQAFESKQKDIYRYYRKPPPELSYGNKRERHRIHLYVYADSPWVDPASIDAEAAELVETDPTQAERFFGNRLVQGRGSYLTERWWDDATDSTRTVEDGEAICLGFDGSRSDDWSALRAYTMDRHGFTPTYGPDAREAIWRPADWPGGRIPVGEIKAAASDLAERYRIVRFYVDPHLFESTIEDWTTEFGTDVVYDWPTNSIPRMFEALTRYREDLIDGRLTHSDDVTVKTAALAARMVAKAGAKYLLGKPAEHQKIDPLMADILAYEAVCDAVAAGWSDSADDGPSIFFLPR